jgi:pyridoxal phosphate-dependent aminotransferase EpsN
LALNGRLASVEPFAFGTAALHLSTQAREDAARCEHKKVGFNHRPLNIWAAIGLGQLRVLDDRVARRRAINARHRENLPGVAFMREAPYGRATNWLTVIQLDSKTTRATPEDLGLALERADIESRPVWKPMHMQPVFKCARYIGGAVAEQLFANGLCLPSGSAMTDADVDRVSDIVSRSVYGR